MFSRSRQSSSSSTGSNGGGGGGSGGAGAGGSGGSANTSAKPAGKSGKQVPVIDFDAEARNLWARLNLDHGTRNFGQWNALDSIYRHPSGMGTIYVGNQTAAENFNLLKSHGITRVVNCTFGESKIPNFHTGRIEYYNFPISHWQMYINSTNASVLAFTSPLFDFIDGAIARGESVLVHCLAGAHRAGTTGVACLIHYVKVEPAEAIVIAKRCRPIIDPIGQLPEFLNRLHRAEDALRQRERGGATDHAASSSGGPRKGLAVLESAYFRGK